MPRLRLTYDARGRVTSIEHRLDQRYGPDAPGERTLLVDSQEVAAVRMEDLRVRGGRLEHASPRGGREAKARERRIREIEAADRAKLSDVEWLALFREYCQLTGRF
ncbi:MAG: hypothetical protein U0821_15215 [Chloroflexota bacterium]